MEKLVSVYKRVMEHDNKSDGVRLFVFKNKNDFMKKYVEDNLIKMKIKEPIHGEKYEDTFDVFLNNINMVIEPFGEEEVIIVGVFGEYVDSIDIGNADVRVYNLGDISFLIDDIERAYGYQ